MSRKIVSSILLVLLATSVLMLAVKVQPVRAIGTITINPDGSVTPPTALIYTADKITYTLTDNITASADGIVIERDNIVLNGESYTLLGSGVGTGATLNGRNNVTVRNMRIGNFTNAIYLAHSLGCTLSGDDVVGNASNNVFYFDTGIYAESDNNTVLSGNIITETGLGIDIESSGACILSGNTVTANSEGMHVAHSNGTLSGNTVTGNPTGVHIWLLNSGWTLSGNDFANNGGGIVLQGSSGNIFVGNNFTNNDQGIYLGSSVNNAFYHNNFIGNAQQVFMDDSANSWDNGYPSGGNYWSDYAGVDVKSGPNQNQPGSDGIGDTPYVVGINNKDNYPLMQPFVAIASLVVRGMDSRIYYRVGYGAGWGVWNVLPGSTMDSPAAAVCFDSLYVVVRGSDGITLWFGSVNLTDSVFSGWTLLSGSTPSSPTLSSNGTALALTVRGGDDRIYYRFYTVATQAWTGWSVLPSGATLDSPAASLEGNVLYIVVRGMDGSTLWFSSVNQATGVFSGWSLLSGSTPSTPTLTTNGILTLVVRGNDNRIYYQFYLLHKVWNGWTALPSGTTLDSPAATILQNTLYIVVRGSDGSSLWEYTGSSWTLLSGSTPSKPTLTS